MLMWLETVWKSMPRINLKNFQSCFLWLNNSQMCVIFCSLDTLAQDEFRNQLLTAVLFAEQLPLCELPPEPEIEDLSATCVGENLEDLFAESFEATSLQGLFFRNFSIKYMSKMGKETQEQSGLDLRDLEISHPTFVKNSRTKLSTPRKRLSLWKVLLRHQCLSQRCRIATWSSSRRPYKHSRLAEMGRDASEK